MKEILNYGKQLWDFKDVNSTIDEFMELYENRPVVNNAGGMSSTHLFWTWYVILLKVVFLKDRARGYSDRPVRMQIYFL